MQKRLFLAIAIVAAVISYGLRRLILFMRTVRPP